MYSSPIPKTIRQPFLVWLLLHWWSEHFFNVTLETKLGVIGAQLFASGVLVQKWLWLKDAGVSLAVGGGVSLRCVSYASAHPVPEYQTGF